MTRSTDDNEDLVRRHFEAINERDWENCADTVADDVTVHQAGETRRGVEWFTEHWKAFYETFPDASISIDEILADDERIAARITNTGTNDTAVPGIESTGTEVVFSTHLIARVEDGVLAELWVVAEQPREAPG